MTYLPIRAADAPALPHCGVHRPGLLRRLLAAARRAVEIERSRRELQALPDELLRDIGITRCDIPAIVAGRHDPTRRFPLRFGK